MDSLQIKIIGHANSGKSAVLREITESLKKHGIYMEVTSDYPTSEMHIMARRTEEEHKNCLNAISKKTKVHISTEQIRRTVELPAEVYIS